MSAAPRVLRLLRVRPEEAGLVFRMLALMFVLFVGFTLGSNAVESLLWARVGADALPYLYVILGPVTFVAVGLAGRVFARGRSVLAPVFLAIAVAVTAFRAVLLAESRTIYAALWIVMMIVWTIGVFNAWAVAGAVHDTRQAKRVYPLYGGGLIAGIVIGGLLTGPLAGVFGPENLLVPWAGASVLAAWLTRSILSRAPGALGVSAPGAGRRRSPRRRTGGLAVGWRAVRVSGLLRWMATSLALFALLYFALSFLFATAAAERYPAAADLAGFIGVFIGAASAAGLLVSMFVANRLFARFGVAAMVLVLPVIYVAGFAVLAIGLSFLVVVGFRFVQMVWVNGVWGPGWQALFNVVPGERRTAVRTFMDAVPLQAGIVAAGGLLILAEAVLTSRQVAIAGAVAAALTLVAVWRARRAYRAAVADALREGNPDVFGATEGGFVSGAADRAAVHGLVSGTADRSALRALAAGASDPDPAVRRLSLDVLVESGAEAGDALMRAVTDPDPDVRETALRGLARSGSPVDSATLVGALADPEAPVRAAAARSAAEAGASAGGDALRRALGAAMSDGDPGVRLAAAAALTRLGDPGARALIEAMALGDDPDQRVAGLGELGVALGWEPSFDAVAAVCARVLPALADPDERVRRAAASALAGAGAVAMEPLERALQDPRTEDAALAGLLELPGADPDALHAFARDRAARALRDAAFRRAIPAEGDERLVLLHDTLDERARANAVRALRALSVGADAEAIDLALENLSSGEADQRANALEILESAGDAAVVRPLMAVWEPPPGSPDGARTVATLLEDNEEDAWIRACAALAAGALDDPALPGLVERVAGSDPDPLVREAAAGGRRDSGMETLATLSLMERVLFLRKVRLFAGLDASDLRAVAEVAGEQVFAGGSVVAAEGEEGDALHVVVTGAIRVTMGEPGREREVAVRGPGEYVGEMAIVSRAPRMASLVAAGDVRVLSIDRRRFERILRDRPEVGLAVMRILADRLRESDAGRGGDAAPAPAGHDG